MKRVGDLVIDQDLTFQEREWRVQRAAWVALLLVVVFGLLGVFGTGPISSATAADAEGTLSVDYQRFVRNHGRTSITLRVDSQWIEEGQIELWISTEYLDNLEIESFSQEPDEVRNDGNRMVFVFLAEKETGPVSVTLDLRPEAMGRLSAHLGVVDGPEVHLSQLGYP